MPIRSSIFQNRQDNILSLIASIETRTKATPEGVKDFLEPFTGVLTRAKAPANHFIFGRRGSGKTSLMLKAAHDLSLQRRAVAFVDIEQIRTKERNDLILAILLKAYECIYAWLTSDTTDRLRERAKRIPFLDYLTARASARTKELDAIGEKIRAAIDALRILSGERIVDRRPESIADDGIAGILAEALSTSRPLGERREEILRDRIDVFGRLFREVSEELGEPTYLLIDDLYRVRPRDQPHVVGFLFTLSRNRMLWLKIGTVKNRTRWHAFDEHEGRVGVQLGQDCDEINLDSSLETFAQTSAHLSKILETCVRGSGVTVHELATPMVRPRLAVASGGVARDYLNIFCESARVTLERTSRHDAGPDKISTDDVYEAAAECSERRADEFHSEIPAADQERLTKLLSAIRESCFANEVNCFLVKTDGIGGVPADVLSLVDLKCCHLLKRHVRLFRRPGEEYTAFMLDLSATAPERATRPVRLVDPKSQDFDKFIANAAYVYNLSSESSR